MPCLMSSSCLPSLQPHRPSRSFSSPQACSCPRTSASVTPSTCGVLPLHIHSSFPHFLTSFRCLLKCRLCHGAFPFHISTLPALTFLCFLSLALSIIKITHHTLSLLILLTIFLFLKNANSGYLKSW